MKLSDRLKATSEPLARPTFVGGLARPVTTGPNALSDFKLMVHEALVPVSAVGCSTQPSDRSSSTPPSPRRYRT